MHLVRPLMLAEIATQTLMAQPLPNGGILWSSFGGDQMAKNVSAGLTNEGEEQDIEAELEDQQIASVSQKQIQGETTKNASTEKTNRQNSVTLAKKLKGKNGSLKTRPLCGGSKAFPTGSAFFTSEESSLSEFSSEKPPRSKHISTPSSKTPESSMIENRVSPISCPEENDTHQIAPPYWEFSEDNDFSAFCGRLE